LSKEENDIKSVEEAVISLYKKVNPSYVDIISDREKYKLISNSREIVSKNLKLDFLLPRFKKIVDIGGGTGESALFRALFGKDIETTIIDRNEKALVYAKMLFDRHNEKLNTKQKSLFELDQSDIAGYDLVVCEGVLHHTAEPMTGLRHILGLMEKGQFLYIALAEESGWFRRQMQRDFVRNYCDGEAEIVQRSKIYFKEHIENSMKYGGRSEESIIYDTFVNPQIQPTDIADLLCNFQGAKLYSSFPPLFLNDASAPINQKELYENKSYDLNYFRKRWKVGYTLNMPSDNVDSIHSALLELREDINNLIESPLNLNLIQTGPMGYGMNFFCLVKES